MHAIFWTIFLSLAPSAHALTIDLVPGQSTAEIVDALTGALDERQKDFPDPGLLRVYGVSEPLTFRIPIDANLAARHLLEMNVAEIRNGHSTPVAVDFGRTDVRVEGGLAPGELWRALETHMNAQLDAIREAGRAVKAIPDGPARVDALTEECRKILGLSR